MNIRHAEVLKLLVEAGRCTEEDLAELSEEEAELVAIDVLKWVEAEGEESLVLKNIENADYDFIVPSIVDFVENPYYLGEDLWYPLDEAGKPMAGEEKQLYTYWKEKLVELYITKPETYHEILVTGAIGIGKTTFMNIVDAYDYAMMLALRQPQRYYGLMPTTRIVFAFFNITKELAEDVGYTQFTGMLNNSAFFREHMTTNLRRKPGFQLESPKNIAFGIGSRFSHTLGQAIFNAQIDEANFGQVTADGKSDAQKSQVMQNYTNLLRRQESRFMKLGKLPGHFKIGSSKQTDSDFLEAHIENRKTNESTMVIDVTQYEAKACRKGLYSGMNFGVLLGDIGRDPRILKPEEELTDELLGFKIDVPVEHRQAFDDSIVDALRDIAGKAARPKSAFILNQQVIRECMSGNRQTPWTYNNKGDQVPNTIHITFGDNDQISDFLSSERLFWWNNGTELPYQYKQRYIAVDTGYATDAAGIAMVCKAGVVVKERVNPVTKKLEKYFTPLYYPDFYIRVKGVDGEEFPLYKLTEFVKFLKKKLKIPIRELTTDGHQSKQLRQDVLLAFPGMDVNLLSTDKDDEAYLTLRNVFYTRGISGMYHDTNLLVELFDLIHKKATRSTQSRILKMIVDHPVLAKDGFIGRKDVTDALAAAITSCSRSDTSVSVEEIAEGQKEMEQVDWALVDTEAEKAIDTALKEIDGMNLDNLLD